MKVCAGRKTSYLNGMTYEECKILAEKINEEIKPEIRLSITAFNRMFDFTLLRSKKTQWLVKRIR